MLTICFVNGNIGRSNFYGVDLVKLLNDFKYKNLTLPEDTILYWGHADTATVRNVKNTNFYFSE